MVDNTSKPYNSIVYVTDTIGGVNYQGSGVMLSADEVLTATHVVFSTGIGTASNVKVSPGYSNGVAPFGIFAGVVTHYNQVNDSGDLISLADTGLDYAIIHLTTPVPGAVGTMSLGSDYTSGLATVSGYPAGVAGQVDQPEAISTYITYNILTGLGLGAGSSGGPVWTGGTSNPTVVGIVSSGSAGLNNGYFNKITSAERAVIQGWVASDEAGAGAPAVVGYVDAVTGAQGSVNLSATSGGPSYLQYQYIWTSSDRVALSTATSNVFLHGGPGQDSLQVTSGQNVLDGGAGSNFLTGGSGQDTFFTDARGTAVVWNTLRNFHATDAATLWGFVPGTSSYTWDTSMAGAVGSTGATLRANIVGGSGRSGDGIDASITFSGLSLAQAQSMVIVTGTQAAGSYLYIYNQGV